MNDVNVISLVLFRAVTPECVVAAHQMAERVEELARDLGLGMDLQELPGAQGVPHAGGGFTWALEHVVVGAGRVEGVTTEGAQAGTSLGAENEVVVIARPRDEVVEDGREADLVRWMWRETQLKECRQAACWERMMLRWRS